MADLVEMVAELKLRAKRVRESLQSARLELEELDRKVSELARQELHRGC